MVRECGRPGQQEELGAFSINLGRKLKNSLNSHASAYVCMFGGHKWGVLNVVYVVWCGCIVYAVCVCVSVCAHVCMLSGRTGGRCAACV